MVFYIIENMMAKACNDATKQLKEELEAEQNRIYEELELDKTAREIEQKVSDIIDTINQFKEKAEEKGCKPKYGYYSSIDYSMRHYCSDMRNHILEKEVTIRSDKMTQLNEQILTVRRTVSTEWNKVISNCRGMRKNKDCVNYLVSLGFNESLFGTESVGTAILVPVNVALLCRKEEVNEVD